MFRFLMVLTCLLSASAWAVLDNLTIKNLDLEYATPYGKGELEFLRVGASKQEELLSVEVFRRESSMDIVTSFVEFQYVKPLSLVHNLQKLSAQKLNLKIDKLEHFAKGEALTFTPDKMGEFALKKYSLTCQGASTQTDPVDRLKEDCLEKMRVTVNHLELPFDFFTKLSQELPEIPQEDVDEMPADDLVFNLTKGDFNTSVKVKYVLRATLKADGHVKMENEGKTIAIRIDQIKFGILPVTSIVMNLLRREINSPHISIDPPWIRIKAGLR